MGSGSLGIPNCFTFPLDNLATFIVSIVPRNPLYVILVKQLFFFYSIIIFYDTSTYYANVNGGYQWRKIYRQPRLPGDVFGAWSSLLTNGMALKRYYRDTRVDM